MLDMNYHQMCIPVMLHGDAAEFQDRDSLNTMSLKGVLMNQDGGQGGAPGLGICAQILHDPRDLGIDLAVAGMVLSGIAEWDASSDRPVWGQVAEG